MERHQIEKGGKLTIIIHKHRIIIIVGMEISHYLRNPAKKQKMIFRYFFFIFIILYSSSKNIKSHSDLKQQQQ